MNIEELTRDDPYVQSFPEVAKFWEAAAQGILLLPRCKACSKIHWHPRQTCPFCWSTDIGWLTSAGKGSIYSYSVIRPRNASPYVLAYVQLQEGILIMSNVVGCNPESISIGMSVQVHWRDTEEGRRTPVFHLE